MVRELRGSEKILHAALQLFGEKGFAATSLREVAARAGVSQALVVHHYGSKEGVRRACDHHVAAVTRENKEAALAAGAQFDPLQVLRQIEQGRPVLRYLARALTESRAETSELIDEFVADAQEYLTAAEDAGYLKPSRTPRERIIVLVLISLGALAMHEHLNRLLGVDLLDDSAPMETLAPYLGPMVELYSQGLFEQGAFEQLSRVFQPHPEGESHE